MIKSAVALVVVAAAVALVAAAAEDKTYTTKYDNVDVDSIVKNDRLLANYIRCLLDQAKCSPDGQELKSHIKDALETGCAKCSEKQKEGSQKVLTFVHENKKKEWEQLVAKYDPDGKWRAKYAREADKLGLAAAE